MIESCGLHSFGEGSPHELYGLTADGSFHSNSRTGRSHEQVRRFDLS